MPFWRVVRMPHRCPATSFDQPGNYHKHEQERPHRGRSCFQKSHRPANQDDTRHSLVVLLRTGSDLRSVHHGVPEPPVLPEAPGVPASADSAPPRPVRKLTRQVSSSVPVPKPLSLFF